jgi:peptide/nickel transport system substrate-binding protein
MICEQQSRRGVHRPILYWICLVGLVLTGTSACSRAAGPEGRSIALTIAVSVPPTNDTASGVNAAVDLLTVESPVAIGWDGRPNPRVIEGWEWDPSGLALRLRLVSGITFHDGTPLTTTLAAKILDGALKGGGVVSTSVTSISADGDRDIVIRTARPEGLLLSDIATANFALTGKARIGTGPFKLESKGPPIALAAFANYRTGRPYIDAVKVAEYPTQRAAWAAMLRGEVDVLHDVSGDSLDFVEAQSTVQTRSFLRAYYHAMVFNLRLPKFARKELRQALNAAVDREQIVEVGLRKRGRAAYGPIWPHHFASSTTTPQYQYDPQLARNQLDAIAMPVRGEVASDRMPSRFRFTCLVSAEDQRLQRIALLVQKQLFAIDVDMDVQSLPWQKVRAAIVTGAYEAVLLPLAATRGLSFVYAWWHSPIPGIVGFPNFGYRAADEPLDRLRSAIAEDAIKAAVAEVQEVLHDDPPAVFLDWMETARALSREIDVPDEGARDIMGTIRLWRPRSTQRASR